LFVFELIAQYTSEEDENKRIKIVQEFKKFSLLFMKRLKTETKKGFDRTNKDLYIFESYLSNAPGELYQIERRHKKMKEFFHYYQKNDGKILGD
jgi:hypothetical protein